MKRRSIFSTFLAFIVAPFVKAKPPEKPISSWEIWGSKGPLPWELDKKGWTAKNLHSFLEMHIKAGWGEAPIFLRTEGGHERITGISVDDNMGRAEKSEDCEITLRCVNYARMSPAS